MKKRIIYVLILLLLQLSACSRRGDVVYQAIQERELESAKSEAENEDQEETETGSLAGKADESRENTGQRSLAEEETEIRQIYVDISGAVKRPGVYELSEDSRMFQAIEAAGGFLETAETRCVNQADALTDGEKVYIYTREEAEDLGGWMQLTGLAPSKGTASVGIQTASGGGSAGSLDGKVNLNRADKAELMTLTGVGEARAEAIIAWRENQGAFSSIEDIMKVSGIKEKLFEQIRDKITV